MTNREVQCSMWRVTLSLFIYLDFNMNVISWNIRGTVNMAGRRVIKEMVKKYNLDIFIILEPHCQFSRVSGFWRKLGFIPGVLVEAVGHSGGIWVLCRVDMVVLKIEEFS